LGEPIGKPGKPNSGLFGRRAAWLPVALRRGCNLEFDELLCWLDVAGWRHCLYAAADHKIVPLAEEYGLCA
jgi:hypothetical protein